MDWSNAAALPIIYLLNACNIASYTLIYINIYTLKFSKLKIMWRPEYVVIVGLKRSFKQNSNPFFLHLHISYKQSSYMIYYIICTYLKLVGIILKKNILESTKRWKIWVVVCKQPSVKKSILRIILIVLNERNTAWYDSSWLEIILFSTVVLG